ncbi:MAG: hypothetical protein AABX88_00635 [Nanoarchaeota archaeon]
MKKILMIPILALLILPTILALNLKIEEQGGTRIMISGVNEYVVFDLTIKNLGGETNLEFYNFLGFSMFPRGTTHFNEGETKNIELKISPIGEFDYLGSYTFDYYIKSTDGAEIKRSLTFKIVRLEDALKIGTSKLDTKDNTIKINVENRVNYDFDNLDAKFSSEFFNLEKSFDLEAKERKEFEIELEKEEFNKLLAGFYTLNTEISVKGKTAKIEGVIEFPEESSITTSREDYGLIINTQIIEKSNDGNTVSSVEINADKNILSRVFTTLNPEPEIVERTGAKISYTWTRQLKPGESLKVTIKTNWFFPLLFVFFIIAVILLAKEYSKTDVVLKKRVSFVRAKGGEFTLKVSIFVNAKKYIERVNIIDRLPQLVKLYDRFGSEQPTRVDEANRKIEWNFEKLEAGEIRSLSYIIYSKVGVIGKFALPSTTAIYERNGKVHESESNKTFFVTEPKEKDEE